MRSAGWWMSIWLCVGAIGCKGAAERCAEAQAQVEAAWRAYGDAMKVDLARAKERTEEIGARMRGDIDRRLARMASAEADRLSQPGTAAWHRTYSARLQAACSSDTECAELRVEARNLEQRIASLEAQIARATEAARSSSLEREAAQAAVRAVEDDFDYPHIKPAREASAKAYEACEGVNPAELVAE